MQSGDVKQRPFWRQMCKNNLSEMYREGEINHENFAIFCGRNLISKKI